MVQGMCGVSSGDVRVQRPVKQIVQLARTVEPGAQLELHMFLPCLIVRPLSIPHFNSLITPNQQAATAARHESHRALLRTKVHAARNENIWIIRGADFVPVLDHLWHGVGAGGAPVMWDDYVNSRCVVLPIDVGM